MQQRLRRLSKLTLNDLVAQKPLGEQAKVKLICLMKFKNKINFNKMEIIDWSKLTLHLFVSQVHAAGPVYLRSIQD